MRQLRCCNPRPGLRGFTALEMVISIGIMGLVALATLGITTSVATGWQMTDSRQASQAVTRSSTAQLYAVFHSARYVGLATSDGKSVTYVASTGGTQTSGSTGGSGGLLTNLVGGVLNLLGAGGSGGGGGGSTSSAGTYSVSSTPASGAACMFWAGDDSNAGVIDLCEMALIEHDIDAGTLVMYRVPATAANAHVQFHPTDMDESSDAASFKLLPNVVPTVLARNVSDAQFSAYLSNGSSVAKVLEFNITFNDGTVRRVEYGNVPLKSSVNSTSGL